MQLLVNTCSIIFNTVCIENYHARYSFVRFLCAYWYYLRILVASTENIQGCEQKYRRERHICSTGDRTNYLLRQVLATYVKDLRTLFIVCTVFLPKLFMPLLLYHSSLFYVVVFAMFFIRLNIMQFPDTKWSNSFMVLRSVQCCAQVIQLKSFADYKVLQISAF